MERQVTNCEKILSNHVYIKGLISKAYKEISKFSKKLDPFLKRSKIFGHFTKDNIWMAEKNLRSIMKMQIKTTIKYHYISTKMNKIKDITY